MTTDEPDGAQIRTDASASRTSAQLMTLLHELDPNAHIQHADTLGTWYLEADISFAGGGRVPSTLACHQADPEQAVQAFLAALIRDADDPLHIIVSHAQRGSRRTRRHWRWNGERFVEEPVTVWRERISQQAGDERHQATSDRAPGAGPTAGTSTGCCGLHDDAALSQERFEELPPVPGATGRRYADVQARCGRPAACIADQGVDEGEYELTCRGCGVVIGRTLEDRPNARG